MTIQDQYTNAAVQAQNAWTSAARTWTQNFDSVNVQSLGQVPPVLPIDLGGAVDQYFTFAERLLKANREYAENLTEAANAFTGAVRQHVDSVAEVVRDQAQGAVNKVNEQADKVERAEREQAEQAEQAERELARQKRQAERQKIREARQAAQERYSGLNKAELSEELAKRNLPKTGNIDELVERLVDADTE